LFAAALVRVGESAVRQNTTGQHVLHGAIDIAALAIAAIDLDLVVQVARAESCLVDKDDFGWRASVD
jgi:hypothetical protein